MRQRWASRALLVEAVLLTLITLWLVGALLLVGLPLLVALSVIGLGGAALFVGVAGGDLALGRLLSRRDASTLRKPQRLLFYAVFVTQLGIIALSLVALWSSLGIAASALFALLALTAVVTLVLLAAIAFSVASQRLPLR